MQNKQCYPGIAERNIEAGVFGMVWFLGPLVINAWDLQRKTWSYICPIMPVVDSIEAPSL